MTKRAYISIFLCGVLFLSCSSYKILNTRELMASPLDRFIRPVEFIDNISQSDYKHRNILCENIAQKFDAKDVWIEKQYLVNQKKSSIKGSWIQVYVTDSPRITNLDSLGYSEPFATEIAIEIKPNIKSWLSSKVIEVHLEKNKEEFKKFFFDTENMTVIRIENLYELANILSD